MIGIPLLDAQPQDILLRTNKLLPFSSRSASKISLLRYTIRFVPTNTKSVDEGLIACYLAMFLGTEYGVRRAHDEWESSYVVVVICCGVWWTR